MCLINNCKMLLQIGGFGNLLSNTTESRFLEHLAELDTKTHVCENNIWFILHFRTLGTILVFTKMFTFWVVSWFVEVGMGDPPPQAKNSHFIPFCLIFLQNKHSGTQNKINLK